MTSITKKYLVLLFASGLFGCAGSDFAGSGKAESSGDGSKNEEKEDETADSPTEVAGAFLTCDRLGGDAIGCTMFTDKKPMPKEGKSFSLALYNDADDEVEMDWQEAPKASEYHAMATVPKAYQDSGHITMTAANIDGSGVPLAKSVETKEIFKVGQELGTSIEDSFGESAPLDPGVAEALKLQSFQVTHSWVMGLAAVASTAVPSDFCDGAGQIRNQLSTTAQVLSDGFTNMFKDPKNPNSTGIGSVNKIINPLPQPTTIGVNTKICFRDFSDQLFGGNSELAHAGSGCIFVMADTNMGRTLLIGREAQGNAALSLPNLREFAKAKNAGGGCN